MPMNDVSGFDLNLLRVFVVLMQEGSVTGAAARLSLGQPAVSQSLARLRTVLGDPLLVRDGRRMQPTDRALRLNAEIGPPLSALEGALRASHDFSPAHAGNTFSVGLPDDLQIALLPVVARRLAGEAPGIRLKVRSISHVTAGGLLETGEVSTVAGVLGSLPGSARIHKLTTCSHRVLRGDSDPAPLDLDTYCSRPHALVTAAGDFRGSIDRALEKLHRVRRVAYSLPQFGTLPSILRDSALLATVPQHVALALATFPGLRSEPLPFLSPTFDVSMAWREAVERDPAEIWLRAMLVDALGSSRDPRVAHPVAS